MKRITNIHTHLHKKARSRSTMESGIMIEVGHYQIASWHDGPLKKGDYRTHHHHHTLNAHSKGPAARLQVLPALDAMFPFICADHCERHPLKGPSSEPTTGLCASLKNAHKHTHAHIPTLETPSNSWWMVILPKGSSIKLILNSRTAWNGSSHSICRHRDRFFLGGTGIRLCVRNFYLEGLPIPAKRSSCILPRQKGMHSLPKDRARK